MDYICRCVSNNIPVGEVTRCPNCVAVCSVRVPRQRDFLRHYHRDGCHYGWHTRPGYNRQCRWAWNYISLRPRREAEAEQKDCGKGFHWFKTTMSCPIFTLLYPFDPTPPCDCTQILAMIGSVLVLLMEMILLLHPPPPPPVFTIENVAGAHNPTPPIPAE